MAGKPGKSGGARPGAGRKPKPKQDPVPQGNKDMLQFLQDVALGKTDATPVQVKAAIAAVQYTHTKKGEGGKKEGKAEAAKKVAGRFGPPTAPKLVVNNT